MATKILPMATAFRLQGSTSHYTIVQPDYGYALSCNRVTCFLRLMEKTYIHQDIFEDEPYALVHNDDFKRLIMEWKMLLVKLKALCFNAEESTVPTLYEIGVNSDGYPCLCYNSDVNVFQSFVMAMNQERETFAIVTKTWDKEGIRDLRKRIYVTKETYDKIVQTILKIRDTFLETIGQKDN